MLSFLVLVLAVWYWFYNIEMFDWKVNRKGTVQAKTEEYTSLIHLNLKEGLSRLAKKVLLIEVWIHFIGFFPLFYS